MLKLSELYTSVQGEGPNVGKMVQFVRFGGCNMRCPGWPCDTQYAIDPKYRDEWEKIDVPELLTRIKTHPQHVVLTGGEPLIQSDGDLHRLTYNLIRHGYKIDLFTNGSKQFAPWTFSSEVSIIMDWKLQGSGEATTGLDMRTANRKVLGRKDAVKFVVANRDDLHEARNLTYEWYNEPVRVDHEIYVGAAWHQMGDQEIIQFVEDQQLPWRLNVQVHKYIWPLATRGV